jgi:hypothetical protein
MRRLRVIKRNARWKRRKNYRPGRKNYIGEDDLRCSKPDPGISVEVAEYQ